MRTRTSKGLEAQIQHMLAVNRQAQGGEIGERAGTERRRAGRVNVGAMRGRAHTQAPHTHPLLLPSVWSRHAGGSTGAYVL